MHHQVYGLHFPPCLLFSLSVGEHYCKCQTKNATQERIFFLCYTKMTSQPWEKDYGNDKRTTSIDLLLRWILSEGNFVQWHSGKDERGQPVSKTALMEDLRRDMVRFGITHRTTNDLQQKLLSILQSFEKAYMWMKTEGKTLRKQGKEQESRGTSQNTGCFGYERVSNNYRSIPTEQVKSICCITSVWRTYSRSMYRFGLFAVKIEQALLYL